MFRMGLPLSMTELERFHSEGFVIRPRFFPTQLMESVREEILAGANPEPYLKPAHGALISHPQLMEIVGQICGPKFLFHHLNSYFQPEGTPGIAWHNDYEQALLPMPRVHPNVIALIYPDGLNGEVGDLVVVPGTQKTQAAWESTAFLGTVPLPGEVVIDNVPPGTVVICHTGLIHCRRQKPGKGPRYFCDTSYVARGPHWPATCQHDWRAMYADCRRLGYDHDGRYAHLFDETQFFDPGEAKKRMSALEQTEIYRRLLSDA
jgi:hypothetical protein